MTDTMGQAAATAMAGFARALDELAKATGHAMGTLVQLAVDVAEHVLTVAAPVMAWFFDRVVQVARLLARVYSSVRCVDRDRDRDRRT